jgi:adenylosuccinate lyase
MNIPTLLALNPLDGRYRDKTTELQDYFSEYALIRYRFKVEIEYLILLTQVPMKAVAPIDSEKAKTLRNWVTDFNLTDAQAIKDWEQTTNHDVKALEYFIRQRIEEDTSFTSKERSDWSRYVHFALTSQDVNNTAIPLMLKDGLQNIYQPLLKQTIQRLELLSAQGINIPMLARTHGQPASPTILGKEIYVFVERLYKQLNALTELPFPAKFGGATGNFNAHIAAYPDVNWLQFADHFVEGILGLKRSQTTTQIEHYDGLSAIFDNLRRINVILIDLCRDIWQYISMGYFGQMVNTNEVGSSAMPHKVNPIDFENAEGNLGMANNFFDYMSNKLPVSRLQRDLTDSTVLRNLGVPIGYTIVALHSLIKGLGKLQINREIIARDLDQNQAVVAEAIQVILKREGIADAYEQLKALTRTGAEISSLTLHAFIDTLPIDEAVKVELRAISPQNYTGNA